jgi:hypothetical protein
MFSIKHILFLIVLLLPTHVHAGSKRNKNKLEPIEKILLFDRYGSPHSSATWLITSRNLLNELEDYLIPARRHTTWIRITSNIVHFYIGEQLSTLNHEIWGHGFRIRSLGGKVKEYKFTFFKGAATHFDHFWKGDTDIPILVSMAGIEANQVLAKAILLQHFKYRSLDTRTYLLFLNALLNLMDYVYITSSSKEKREDPGNDINHYIKEMNAKHQVDGLQVKHLSDAMLSLWCNPVWIVAAYLINKDSSFAMPHIAWNHVAYMPLIRPSLTPFGIAYYVENYIGYQEKTFLVSLYGGSSDFYTAAYGGVGITTEGLWTYDKYALDIETHLWLQPKLLLTSADVLEDKNYWGGLLGIRNSIRLHEHFSLHTALLYKTKGFVEGIIAHGGWSWQIGLSFRYGT